MEVGAQPVLEVALRLGELEVLGGGVLDRHVAGQRAERVRDVGDPGEVVVQRVGLVDAHAAVQVVADPQRLRALGHQPVGADGEVVGGVEVVGDPPGGVVGGEVEGARGDVDVGHLHRHRLELRQRPAELLAALHVLGGEVAGARHQPGGGEQQPGDGEVGEPAGGAVGERLGRGAVEHDGVRGESRRRAGLLQGHPGPAGSTSTTTSCRRRPAGGDEEAPGVGGAGRRRSCGRSRCRRRRRTWSRAADRSAAPPRAGPGSAGRRRRPRRAARSPAGRRCRGSRASARRSRASPRRAGGRPGHRSRAAGPPPPAGRAPRRRARWAREGR